MFTSSSLVCIHRLYSSRPLLLLAPMRVVEGDVPLFVFDAGYDPVQLQRGLEGSACQILVRLRAGVASTATRASPIRPHTSDALVATGPR